MAFRDGDVVMVRKDAVSDPKWSGARGTVVEIIDNGQMRVRSDQTGDDKWFTPDQVVSG
ncbi:hypothetical protein K6L44_00235 [Gluconacetobacter entanii]|jgi:hypothetical protein|uniref:DUF3553 domain-containing protein n=1 Tax=Gluconacetobacter entanii TaxID=108528 RepID=A0ABT3K5S6_9PROT|nr:hypothetical protein [Gluconacetobacter entanii]MCE2578765.1 hypothetical protein [Komagataeibacter sp. FNDCR1]MBY4638451.1 hypothetical protein [Gluconacetobacter entanii]MCW4581566.1 hypothetical protein [Gluconacetobacter entanii]MCW4585012.1 hypothetical protein [Gluconacetobacter entanii]MCW4588426.1 hypothetical protein [Gluconacetobacter entanii]